MDIKQQLVNIIQQLALDLTGKDIEVRVDIPTDASNGDFTTNIAMLAFAKAKNNELRIKNYASPIALAERIAEHLNSELIIHNSFRLVEVKAPGFINFFLTEKEIVNQVNQVLGFRPEKIVKEKELILEFGDLNPFKEPHLGHVRMLTLGESIARLFESTGVKVVRANYEGDVGMHVAKALYGIKNHELGIMNMDDGSLEERAKFLGQCYAAGAKAFEEDDSAKKDIISINKKIYQRDSQVIDIWEKGRKWSLEYFEVLYQILGVKYKKYYFESETAPVGKEIVVKNTGKVFIKDDGAIVFRGEDFGLHTRVFVNSEGNPTYEGKDLGLAFAKNQDFPDIDKSIIMTANEQNEYFKVLLKALEKVNSKISEKTSHLSMGFVNLKEGKMSSRTGNVVSAFWLLDETRKRLKDGFKEVPDDVLEDLTVASVKWAMLQFSRESNISFSIEESIQIEGNSGPYMLYSYARTQSLLGKASSHDFEANLRENLDQELVALLRIVCQFKIVVNDSTGSFSPNILCNYLYELAQNFNKYYEKEKIVGSEKENEKMAVVNAVGIVLKKGLYLLGIPSPEKI